MQVVGYFVGTDADQGRRHFVDGPIKLVERDIVELPWEWVCRRG